ncbi:MAG: DUF3471 domain-containing protein [Acidobacteriota bacterium]|nr:DUF3471 domain-containing protein [Acidobacteriota bacterium]
MTKQLTDYLGHYHMAPRMVVSISADGDQLMGQLRGRPLLPLQHDGEDTFSVPKSEMVPVDLKLHFGRNEQGAVDHLIINQNGQDARGEKLHTDAGLLSGALESLQGDWLGSVGFPGRKMRIGMSFFANGDGSLGAYISSPDQHVSYIPVTRAEYADGSLTVQSEEVGAVYEGAVKEKKGRIVSIKGKWNQKDQSITLKLTPVSA